ncbi:MAG TPA: YdcF family protein [Sedimentisphaerales bacterium]|nr:YdcF family protein [Sedimentisphaerales bacterium]
MLIKSLSTPIVWVLLLLIAGVILTRWQRGRRLSKLGWWLTLLGLLVLLTASLEPVGNLLVYSLEHRYVSPTPQTLETLDLIVVLGGGIYPSGGLREYPDLGREAYPRLYRGVQYFKQSGADAIAFCGGPPRPGEESEAQVMKSMALTLGVPAERMVVEADSHNTMQNATNLAALLPKAQGRRIGLVTSATHMMRSKGVFERAFPQDTIVPIPVCFTHRPAVGIQERLTPRVAHLERTTVALHEWIGLLWYAVRY